MRLCNVGTVELPDEQRVQPVSNEARSERDEIKSRGDSVQCSNQCLRSSQPVASCLGALGRNADDGGAAEHHNNDSWNCNADLCSFSWHGLSAFK